MREYSIACIPGDGIGQEVIAAGRKVLDAAQEADGGFRLEYAEFPWSCEYYTRHGEMMPKDGLKQLEDHQAVYLGAVGFPSVPDHVSLWGLLLPIRQGFQQYVNYRPVQLLPGYDKALSQTWLPFQDHLVAKSTPGSRGKGHSSEALWSNTEAA